MSKLVEVPVALNGSDCVATPKDDDRDDRDDDTFNRKWSTDGTLFQAASNIVDKIPSGLYIAVETQTGIGLEKQILENDNLVLFDNPVSKEVMETVVKFWDSEETYKNFGICWKRGILLHGPAGSGKTSLVVQVIEDLILNQDGIALMGNPYLVVPMIKAIKQTEPNRKVVVLMEDIDSMIDSYGESSVLQVLDGEEQFSKIIFLATTNYPENLPERLINRPSRFDLVRYVGFPPKNVKNQYIRHLCKDLDEELIDEIVNNSQGYSIAHIKEILISLQVFGNSLRDTLERIDGMLEESPSSEVYASEDSEARHPKSFVGFVNTEYDKIAAKKSE
jgi:GTPase SAR1 family protein